MGATYSASFISFIAALASSSQLKRTKPKPLERPVSLSITTAYIDLDSMPGEKVAGAIYLPLLLLSQIPQTSVAE